MSVGFQDTAQWIGFDQQDNECDEPSGIRHLILSETSLPRTFKGIKKKSSFLIVL